MHSAVLATFLALASLSAAPAQAGDQKTEALKAGGAVAVGAVAGGGAFAVIGSGGLAIAGTAVTIGAAPFIAVGAVVGLAGYGIYRLASDSSAPSDAPTLSAKPPVAAVAKR